MPLPARKPNPAEVLQLKVLQVTKRVTRPLQRRARQVEVADTAADEEEEADDDNFYDDAGMNGHTGEHADWAEATRLAERA